MAGRKTVKKPSKELDSQPTGFVRENFALIVINFIFILLALTLLTITVMFFLDRTEKNSKLSPSPTVLPEQSGQLTDTETQKDLVVPIRPGARQLVEQTELDALRSLLAPHGWDVRQDSIGNLVLFPGMAASAPTTGTGTIPLPVETDLTSLRSFLEPHGWRIQADTEKGGILLIPISSP